MMAFMTASSRTRGERFLLAVAVVPPLVLALLTAIYAVDLPQLDEWRFVPDIEKTFAGTLTLQDVWRQHNDHRIFFPKAVILFLARVSHWDTRWECATSIGLAIVIFALIILTFRALLGPLSARPTAKAILAISIVVFSLNQWQNWLWGMQLIILMCVAATMAAIALLSQPRSTTTQFLAAIGGAVVATYSFGSGLLIWPAGLLIIVASGRANRFRRVIGWSVAAVVTLVGFFYRLQRPSAPRALASVAHPGTLIRYVLTHIGAPIVSFTGAARPPRDAGVAIWVGAIGVTAAASLTYQLVRKHPIGFRRPALILASIIVFAIGNSMLTALARVQMGIPQAFASRYGTISNLFWLALIGLVELASLETGAREWWTVGWPVVLLALVSSVAAAPMFRERHRLLEPFRVLVARCDVDERVFGMYKPTVIPKTLGILRFRGLSALRTRARLDCTNVATPRPVTLFADLLVLEQQVGRFGPAETRTIQLRVTNPTIEPWPNSEDAHGRFCVYASSGWKTTSGADVPVAPLLTRLPYPLFPGRSIVMNMDVVSPPRAGEYMLSIDLLQKGVGWFAANGAEPLTVPVDVHAPSVSR
jgi:hypothetical protein